MLLSELAGDAMRSVLGWKVVVGGEAMGSMLDLVTEAEGAIWLRAAFDSGLPSNVMRFGEPVPRVLQLEVMQLAVLLFEILFSGGDGASVVRVASASCRERPENPADI